MRRGKVLSAFGDHSAGYAMPNSPILRVPLGVARAQAPLENVGQEGGPPHHGRRLLGT